MKTVKEINNNFLTLAKPKNLDGNSNENIIIQFEVQFAELCIAVMTNGIPDPETLTVLKFYSALKYFETKHEKQKTNESNRNRQTLRR